MPVETVKVSFVNPPEAGKKYGSIKTKDNKRISIKPAQVALFQPGQSYEIEYNTTPEGYHNLVRVLSTPPQAAPKPNGQARGNWEPADGRAIFITGVVGRAMGSGKFESTDILLLAMEAGMAYDKVCAPPKVVQHTVPHVPAPREAMYSHDGPDDEIPF